MGERVLLQNDFLGHFGLHIRVYVTSLVLEKTGTSVTRISKFTHLQQ